MRTTKILFALVTSVALATPLALCDCGSPQVAKTEIKPGSMPAGASWDGVYYNAVWGFLHLQSEGTSFNARWKRADESAWGEMHGTITGDVAHFEWQEHKMGLVGPSANTKGKGYFRYTRPEGDNVDDRIVGEWGFDASEGGGGEWDSIKQRNMKPDLKSIKGETEPTVGGWK
jgi:hypothetical protein